MSYVWKPSWNRRRYSPCCRLSCGKILLQAVSFPQLQELNFPPNVSSQAPHQWREEILEVLYISGASLHMICIADINIRSYDKRYQGFLPETVGALGGMLGDGVDVFTLSLHNLEWGGVAYPKLKGWINQRPTCLKDSPKRDLVPMRSCAKPWATN